jgi:hypothetical protein
MAARTATTVAATAGSAAGAARRPTTSEAITRARARTAAIYPVRLRRTRSSTVRISARAGGKVVVSRPRSQLGLTGGTSVMDEGGAIDSPELGSKEGKRGATATTAEGGDEENSPGGGGLIAGSRVVCR